MHFKAFCFCFQNSTAKKKRMTLLVTADCIRLVDDETKVSKLLNELSGCVSRKVCSDCPVRFARSRFSLSFEKHQLVSVTGSITDALIMFH